MRSSVVQLKLEHEGSNHAAIPATAKVTAPVILMLGLDVTAAEEVPNGANRRVVQADVVLRR